MDPRERLNDPEEAQRAALAGLQARMRTAFPGIVVAADLEAQTLTVQPAIQGEIGLPDGTTQVVDLPLLIHVPICWPRAGGFALTMPVAAGDEVLVVLADRCIDAWWQSGGIGQAIEPRMHDLSDGFAILAPTSQPRRLPAVSSTSMQMRNEAGTAYIELTADGDLNFVSRNQTFTASQGLSFSQAGTSPVTWSAANINIASGTLKHNGVEIGSTHVHSNVTNGPDISGVPV